MNQKKAAVLRRYPFTVILKEEAKEEPSPFRLKIDPGSKVTGVAIVDGSRNQVIFAAELQHRGGLIHKRLESRAANRGSRRHRNTRYREPRFLNRKRPEGWLAPSLMSRIYNIETWVNRFRRFCPITAFSMELVKFDTQLLTNPEISGVQYLQGELQGYEVREYLLEKWGRKCAYCGKTGVPLEIEHIIPKSRGGTNRVSNLTLACHDCNDKKDRLTAAEFGHPEVQAQAKMPLKDAAMMNATRWKLYELLKATGLPVDCGTGGRTKFNRTSQGYPKAHWVDAACVGESGDDVRLQSSRKVLSINACGYGSRQVCRPDKYGFPRTSPKGAKTVRGFRTGDIVKAVVPAGKREGTHTGRVAVRTRGSFNIGTSTNLVTDISWKHCRLLHRMDGYSYSERSGATHVA